MKSIFNTIFFLFILCNVNAQEQVTVETDSLKALIGEWVIDLRPTPQSEGYFQPFVVKTVNGKTFTGTFYGSELENTLLNTNWDILYFAFTTKDVSNEYYHSGYLKEGKLYGITYCPNREFTAPWTGIKK